MIIPTYWAEAKITGIINGRKATIKRFGWSDNSEQDAARNAQQRANEALENAKSGGNLRRIDHKVAYNGGEGLPIREEIVARHGDTIITRNSYGALCLNTPDILFADIDYDIEPHFNLSLIVFAVLLILFGGIAIAFNSNVTFYIGAFVSLIFSNTVAKIIIRSKYKLKGGFESIVMAAVKHYTEEHPDSNFRLYKTPRGYRVLAMHAPFDPSSNEPFDLLNAWNSDKLYVQMCKNQQCFRARVSPKPWRIGVSSLPRPKIWPIDSDKLSDRENWVKQYNEASKRFASCKFITEIGSRRVDTKADSVRRLHDEYSNATSNLPLA